MKDYQLMNHLGTQRIRWKFNLSRGPWWEGMFEGIIVRKGLEKVVRKGLLTYEELEKVVLDVECFTNTRPLCYQKEKMDMELLTPNV